MEAAMPGRRMILEDYKVGAKFVLGLNVLGYAEMAPTERNPKMVEIQCRRVAEVLEREIASNVVWLKLQVEGLEEIAWLNQHAFLAAGGFVTEDDIADPATTT